ncbi:MAG TPA: SDR family oxidoreductase [Acidimicrobiales bacterium]|nr:SDR family oxidoreductase [Acidimicrobiales bacterium]
MIVLVTGGSSGIGLATVRRLAAAGHQVIPASRRPTRAELPAGATPVVLDVTSAESATVAVERVVEEFGGLDVLVNNAGLGSIGPVEETDDGEAHRVFDVNFFGPMRLARLVVPLMRSRGAGRIINVTSMNDVLPAPFGSWYSASKAALASASFVLGAEVRAFGIFVSIVAPGFFRTDMAAELGAAPVDPRSNYRDTLRAMRAEDTRRLDTAGDPDEVALAIEACINSAEPPARVVVGRDAMDFDKLVRESTPDDLAKMVQDYVAQLSALGQGDL